MYVCTYRNAEESATLRYCPQSGHGLHICQAAVVTVFPVSEVAEGLATGTGGMEMPPWQSWQMKQASGHGRADRRPSGRRCRPRHATRLRAKSKGSTPEPATTARTARFTCAAGYRRLPTGRGPRVRGHGNAEGAKPPPDGLQPVPVHPRRLRDCIGSDRPPIRTNDQFDFARLMLRSRTTTVPASAVRPSARKQFSEHCTSAPGKHSSSI